MVMPMLAVNQRGAAGKSCELPWSAAVANLQCWFSDQTVCSNSWLDIEQHTPIVPLRMVIGRT
jgi:hypothetical protein